MRFITVATEDNLHLNRLKVSCEKFGIPLEVIGLGEMQYTHALRLGWISTFLKTLDPSELVMFTDAYDVIYTAPPNEIKEKYETLNKPFVISAEQVLFVKGLLLKKFYYWIKHPIRSPKPYRFLNAGSWIGRTDYIIRLFNKIESLNIRTTCDQTQMAHYYLKYPDSMFVDCRNDIFSCNGGRAGLFDKDYQFINGRLKNQITGTYPVVFHSSGKNYFDLDIAAEQMGLEFEKPKYCSGIRRKYRKKCKEARRVAFSTNDNILYRILRNVAFLAIFSMLIYFFLL